MASNARFHNKYHRRNHHTLPSAGYPDSGADPIASPQEPFLGDFHAVGALSATGNLTVGGNTLIYGNLSALGNFSFIDTFVTVTSALSVVNDGTGPAFTVQQKGAQPVAIFFDDSNKIFNLKDGLRAEFFNSNATNTYALAEGQATLAQGNASHSEGISTQAFGQGSHAEGAASTATGDYSHAEGDATQAIGNASHSEGDSTVASGEDSHAEGVNTIASGSYSHAEGVNTRAAGLGSHAAGSFAVAAHDRTWVWKGDTNFESVTSTRTDQFMVSAAGGVYVPGNVGVGTDSIANALTVVGNVSASRSIVGTSLSGRFVDISHTPANDGNNPYLRIGEATSDAVNFSGFKIEYNETVNDLNLSAIGFNTSREALKITSAGNTRINLLSAISPNYDNLTAVTRGISGAGLDNLSHLINGRVGINNQAPVSSYALHVKGGNIRVDGVDYSAVPGFDGTTYDSDGQSLFDLRSAAPNANYSLSIASSGVDNFMKFFGGRSLDQKTFVAVRKGQPMRFAQMNNFYGQGFSEVARIGGNSNVSIGLSADGAERLTVLGNISASGTISAGGVGNSYFADNVGIGTNTPEQKLHVMKASAGTVTADIGSIAVFEGGGSGNNHISILTPDAQGGGIVFGSPSDSYGSYVSWNHDNNALKIATAKTTGFIQLLTNNEVEAVRITSSGNVGIGVTNPVPKLTVSGNISALSAVHTIGIPPGVIPALFKIDGISLLAPVGTRVPLYTVPAGMKFSASGFKLIITSTNQSAPFTVGFAPSIALSNNASSKLINDLVLSTSFTYVAGNIVNQSGGYGGGGAVRIFSTDTVGVEIVTPAFAGGGTITTMTASVIVMGELFY